MESGKLLLLLGDGAELHLRHRLRDRQNLALQLRGGLALLDGGLTLAQLAVLVDREQDQLAAVLLQALHVLLARLDRLVATTAVDGDANGAGERSGQTGILQDRHEKTTFRMCCETNIQPNRTWNNSRAQNNNTNNHHINTHKRRPKNAHLDLLQRETAAGTQLGVVPDRRAVHHRADRAAGRTREQGASLLHTVLAAALLASGLVEPGANVTLPPLVEMRVRNHIVALTHLDGVFLTAETKRRRRTHETSGEKTGCIRLGNVVYGATDAADRSRIIAQPESGASHWTPGSGGRPSGPEAHEMGPG